VSIGERLVYFCDELSTNTDPTLLTLLELYLLAYGPLRSVFQAHELTALADTMVERNIRLHQGLDEIVTDSMEKSHNSDSHSDHDSVDEIEENAQELRRLMPY
jgi:hypothetical protein